MNHAEMVRAEQEKEDAMFDYLGARDAALNAAVGHLIVDNVSNERLRIIAETTSDEIISLAARTVLHHRTTTDSTETQTS